MRVRVSELVWVSACVRVCVGVRMCLPDHKNESLFDKIRARVERKKNRKRLERFRTYR